MKPGPLEEKIEALKKPAPGDKLGEGWRALKGWWEKPGIYRKSVDYSKKKVEETRVEIAQVCRGLDGPYNWFRTRLLEVGGSLWETDFDETRPTKAREGRLRKIYPSQPKHTEEKLKQDVDPLFKRSKDILKEIEKKEKDDSIVSEAGEWFKKRFTAGLNKVRGKYTEDGVRPALQLFESDPGNASKPYNSSPEEYQSHLRLHNHAKVMAHEVLKQETNNPKNLPRVDYVYRPPVESHETDTPDSFNARNETYWEERKAFGYDTVVLQGDDFENLLYDADKYLSQALGADYKKLNRNGMNTIHIATAEKGEKKVVVIMLTGKEGEGTPDEDILKNNEALEEMETVTTPPPTAEYWKDRYEKISRESVIAEYIMNRLDSPYAASVAAELEKAVSREYGVEIAKGGALTDYKVLGSTVGVDAVELKIPLAGQNARTFVITKSGLIITKPKNKGKKSGGGGSDWGGGDDSIMSWKEFFDDLTPEGEPKRTHNPSTDEGLSRFPLEKGSYEMQDGNRRLTAKASSTDKQDYAIPFGKQNGIKEIEVKNTSSGAVRKMIKRTDNGKHKGSLVIQQSDIAALMAVGDNKMEIKVSLKGGESFVIPNVIINRSE